MSDEYEVHVLSDEAVRLLDLPHNRNIPDNETKEEKIARLKLELGLLFVERDALSASERWGTDDWLDVEDGIVDRAEELVQLI